VKRSGCGTSRTRPTVSWRGAAASSSCGSTGPVPVRRGRTSPASRRARACEGGTVASMRDGAEPAMDGQRQKDATTEPMWMVSVDDHVVEPPEVWQARVPAKFKDRAPRVVPLERGSAWLFDGKTHPISGMWAVVGKPPSEWSVEPTTFDEMPRGAFDPVAR